MVAALAFGLVFGLHALAFAVDDFYCHRRRGLGRWEIAGHPADTLSVVAALSVPAFVPLSAGAAWVFAVLAVLSGVLVTKDEFVHYRLCDGFEMWLHAVMFLLHPLQFVAVALAWVASAELLQAFPGFELLAAHGVAAIRVVWGLALAVFVYQLIFWGKRWPET